MPNDSINGAWYRKARRKGGRKLCRRYVGIQSKTSFIIPILRKTVSDDYLIMWDSTQPYEYPDVIRVGVAMQKIDYWYEDPLADDDLYAYTKLKQQLHISSMTTELPTAGSTSYVPG